MKTGKIAVIAVGVVIILASAPLGSFLADLYLWLLGGMETERFLVVIGGCIRSFQIVGALCVALGTIKTRTDKSMIA